MKVVDLSGKQFGKLTVVSRDPVSKHGQATWLCQCDCGNTTTVPGYSLRAGYTRSCGCLPKPYEDLTGQKFHRLTVLERAGAEHKKILWRCKCDCGNETVVYGSGLKNAKVKSCGCLRTECKEDLLGQRFERLLVVAAAPNKGEVTRWLCRCDCGSEKIITSRALKTGNTKSCGCLRAEMMTTHGLIDHPLYSVYKGIVGRCYQKSNVAFHNYGGRGIHMCDSWKNDPKAFIEWALSAGWSPGLTIDRVDNDDSYGPDNCKISTMKEQARNRRTTQKIVYNGEERLAMDVIAESGLLPVTVRGRVAAGWSWEKALTEPLKK